MRVIKRKPLVDFGKKHPMTKTGVDHWYRTIKLSHYKSFNDLRKTFKSADQVGKFTVFNIGGNKARLITAIHYNTQRGHWANGEDNGVSNYPHDNSF